MNCSHCRSTVDATTGRCVACGRRSSSGPDVAAGVLTPAPVPNSDDLDTTGMPAFSLETRIDGIDSAATRYVAPTDLDVAAGLSPAPVSTSDDLDTTGMPAFSLETRIDGIDSEVTRYVAPADPGVTMASPGSGVSDSELTRLTPTDVSVARAAAQPGARAGLLAVGEAFGRYHIIRVLGVGGMGAVYHAWDAELGASVALKVIRPEATGDPGAAREMRRRFKQELVLARKVTHKNVVRIHDLGEIDGIKYISMPFLEGSDLASVLKQEGKLPVARALRIVRDVAAGLTAAHDAGIVHRDLKPANIMVEGDLAIIMDFGIARGAGGVAPAETSGAGPDSLVSGSAVGPAATVVGTVLGTVQYMAPEQAKGEAVDQRVDIYALGLIFADMLLGSGRTSGAFGNAFEELRHRMTAAPPRVRATDATIPEAVDALIARCVQLDPDARFQTSKDLVAELDRLDELGVPIPVRRVVGIPMVSAVVAVLLALSVGVWWYFQRLIPAAEHPPVTVLIADFANGTGEPALDHTLEPMLKLALEGATFISAYDRSSLSRLLGVQPPTLLDEKSATELAVKQGVGVVISGTMNRQSRGFGIELKAVQPVDGKVLATASGSAVNKEQMVASVAQVATRIRNALGDDTTNSRFSQETIDTLSATSLDVVRQYAVAMEALSSSRNEEALQGFSKAVGLDPKFGLAYAGMAIASRNLDRHDEAEKFAKQALEYLDGMTERERYRARGLLYLVTGDYRSCSKEYGDLIKKYPADAAAHNNFALCSTHLRDFTRSLQARRQAVSILPKRSLYRFNLAVDASYSGDFKTGEKEAREAQQLGSDLGAVALAFAQLGDGRLTDARDTYEKLAANGRPSSASRARSGLAELAAYGGRFSEAVRLLEEGAAADLAAKNAERAADKYAAAAYVQLLRGDRRAAVAAADKALAGSQSSKIRFLTARVFVAAGEVNRAQKAAADLGSEVTDEPQALGKIIEGQIALERGDARQAVRILTDANKVLETWIGRFDLGRAYRQAGMLTQADSEFDWCLTRRGQSLSLFLDDEPTFSFLPSAYYEQGLVREAMKTAAFADSYRAYLAIRGNAGEDPVVRDIRRRIGS